MASKYYDPGPERAPRVRDLFAVLAPRYDLVNDLQSFGWHRLWKRRLVKLANPHAPDRALDVCCGTGDIAFALAAGGATTTTGFDFSENMLAVARRRQAELHEAWAKGIQFMQGDALALPFDDAVFDLVTISYGLRNLSDFDRGLRELTRVLAPGGRLLVLEFGKPDNRYWRWIYYQHLRWICPIFGRVFCGGGDTHAYILDSLKAYPGQYAVDAALKHLGYAETRIIPILGGMMTINYGKRSVAKR